MPEIDHEYTNEAVCPWCGNEVGESWEFGDYVDDYECDDCGKHFNISRNTEITYCTSRNKCEGDCDYRLGTADSFLTSFIKEGKNYTVWYCRKCHDEKILTGPVGENNEPYVIPLPDKSKN